MDVQDHEKVAAVSMLWPNSAVAAEFRRSRTRESSVFEPSLLHRSLTTLATTGFETAISKKQTTRRPSHRTTSCIRLFRLRNRFALRIEFGGFQFAFELFLEFGSNIVFDAFGRVMKMIVVQFEVLADVGFPQAVRSQQ